VTLGAPSRTSDGAVVGPSVLLVPRISLQSGDQTASAYLFPSVLRTGQPPRQPGVALPLWPTTGYEIGWWQGPALQQALKQLMTRPSMAAADVAGVPAFQPATVITSAMPTPGCPAPAGATFTEPDRSRVVAPALSLDASHWPATVTEGLARGEVTLDEARAVPAP